MKALLPLTLPLLLAACTAAPPNDALAGTSARCPA